MRKNGNQTDKVKRTVFIRKLIITGFNFSLGIVQLIIKIDAPEFEIGKVPGDVLRTPINTGLIHIKSPILSLAAQIPRQRDSHPADTASDVQNGVMLLQSA